MSKRTRTPQPDANLAFLRDAMVNADIINLAEYNKAADAARILGDIDRAIAAGKPASGDRDEAWRSFLTAADAWKATQKLADRAKSAYDLHRLLTTY
jgi:hypothetical protein